MKQAISELKYNLVHVSFLVLNLIGFAWMWTHATDWHFFVKYFSNQSFELAIVYSIVSLIKHTRESRITQILHELSFTYNIITCLGYWIVVRPYIINIISCNYLSHILVQFTLCNDFTHTVPILMMVLIHYLENLEYFHRENLKYQIYLMVLATIVNVFYTFWDRPVYNFMTYEDIGTAVFLIGGFAMIIMIFFGMGKVTKMRKKSLKTL